VILCSPPFRRFRLQLRGTIVSAFLLEPIDPAAALIEKHILFFRDLANGGEGLQREPRRANSKDTRCYVARNWLCERFSGAFSNAAILSADSETAPVA
jgi:hypothetical protein